LRPLSQKMRLSKCQLEPPPSYAGP
jgi:hypothetical protein